LEEQGEWRGSAQSIEEYFNKRAETIVSVLLREGLEYDDKGNLVKIDFTYTMGAKAEVPIAKNLK